MLELNPVEKPKERAKGKGVLKSVAGAMALIGALFLVCHIRYGVCSWNDRRAVYAVLNKDYGFDRQKREKEKSIESISLQQTHRLAQELPEQKRVDAANTAGLYPGERLEF